jgi:hypothetical protein
VFAITLRGCGRVCWAKSLVAKAAPLAGVSVVPHCHPTGWKIVYWHAPNRQNLSRERISVRPRRLRETSI